MLLERGIVVSYETIRCWAMKFGADCARRLKPKAQSGRDVWRHDEVVVTINGEERYLWRAVDQDGYVFDNIVQIRRNTKAARRVLTRLLHKRADVQSASSLTSLVPTPRQSVRACQTSITVPTGVSIISRRIPTLRHENGDRQVNEAWSI